MYFFNVGFICAKWKPRGCTMPPSIRHDLQAIPISKSLIIDLKAQTACTCFCTLTAFFHKFSGFRATQQSRVQIFCAGLA